MVQLHLVERYDIVDELHTGPGRRTGKGRRRKEGRRGVCGEREGDKRMDREGKREGEE